MKKILLSLLATGIALSSFSGVALAGTVSGIRSLNNEERYIDYKVTNEEIEKTAKDMEIVSSEKEVFIPNPERNIGEVVSSNAVSNPGNSANDVIPDDKFRPLTSPLEEQQLSWLIENNIISREKQITVDSSGSVTVDRKESLYNKNSPLDPMNRTDFLMGIYKAIYGTISSRPLLIKVDSFRDAEEEYIEEIVDEETGEVTYRISYYPKKVQKVSGTGKNYRFKPFGEDTAQVSSFIEGDYYQLVSPNVFELYLKELLDKGIVDINSISDMEFRKSYEALGKTAGNQSRTYPRWYNKAAPFMVGNGPNQKNDLDKFIEGSRVWGSSFSVIAGGSGCTWPGDISCQDRGYSDSRIVVNYLKATSTVDYFVDEKVDSMSALKYVESMLRLTEKDMTDTEAKIISYKYGAQYLNEFPDEDRKTVMFLTAKGILNFEDDTEYRNLYGELSKEFAYKLMYRLANKNARLDFSKIQLTDSDNFWIEQGFGQSTISMNYLNQVENDKFRNADGSYPFSPLPEVETLSVEVVETPNQQEARVTSFLGIKMFSSKSSYAAPKTKSYLVKKVFDSAEKYKYRGISLKDTERIKTAQWVRDVSGPTQNDFRVTVSFLVEASSAAMAVATVDSNISIGTDFLFEKSGVAAVSKFKGEDGKMVTLVPASVFRDNGPTLGQKILVMEDKVLKNMETGTTAVLLKERNMALVGTHVITGKELMVESINGEIYYNLDVIKALLSNTYISTIDPNSIYISAGILNEKLANVVPATGNSIGKTYVAQFEVQRDGDTPSTAVERAPFVNISQLTTSSNFLIKEFEERDPATQKVVKYKMIMQLVYKVPDKDANFLNPIYKSENPSLKEINDFVYKRPEDPELADWWDNNLALSNAFANVFYDTKGVEYVKSGYLVPNITVLFDSKNRATVRDQYLHKVLEKVGTHLSDDWVSRFMGDISTYNKPVTKADDKTNKGSAYYPEKKIPVNQFPLWVHAMFNNTEGAGTKTGKKNGTLWREMMADRTFNYEMGVSPAKKGISIYQSGQETFVETSGGAVYMRVNPTSANYPAKLVADGKELDDSDSWSGKKSFTFKPQMRTDSESQEQWIGKKVKYGKESFYVNSIDGTNLQLVDVKEITGVPVESKRGNSGFYDITGQIKGSSRVHQNAIKFRYEELRELFMPENISGYKNSVVAFDKAKTVARPPSDSDGSSVVFVDTGITKLSKESSKVYYNTGTAKWTTFNEAKKGKVNAYTAIQISMNKWSIASDGTLVPRKTFPFLQVGNIYFSGINNTLMDSIISKYVGTVSVSKIEEGATLLIGDMMFTKRGTRFVSEPQENMKSWLPLLKNAENMKTMKNTIFASFTGMGVNKGNIEVGNIPVPLASFVKNPALDKPAPQNRKITLLGSDNGKNALVYYFKKDGTMTAKAYNKKNIPAVSGVTFSVDLDSVLRARKVDSDSKAYVLMMSTNSLSEGYLENVPFFNESLSLDNGDDIMLLADRSTFKPMLSANDIRDQFMLLYNRTFQGDLVSFIKGFSIMLLALISVLSFVGFAILKSGMFGGFFHAIKYPRSGTRSGIDLVKVMTLGLFNLESDLSAAKLVVSNIMLFGIMYLILGVA